jgi:hypothetical protein
VDIFVNDVCEERNSSKNQRYWTTAGNRSAFCQSSGRWDVPVTEEQAWAILYQSAKTGLQCFTSANPREMQVMKCVVVGETSQLWIHRDGHVHPHSFQVAADSIEGECQLSSALLLLPHTVHIII